MVDYFGLYPALIQSGFQKKNIEHHLFSVQLTAENAGHCETFQSEPLISVGLFSVFRFCYFWVFSLGRRCWNGHLLLERQNTSLNEKICRNPLLLPHPSVRQHWFSGKKSRPSGSVSCRKTATASLDLIRRSLCCVHVYMHLFQSVKSPGLLDPYQTTSTASSNSIVFCGLIIFKVQCFCHQVSFKESEYSCTAFWLPRSRGHTIPGLGQRQWHPPCSLYTAALFLVEEEQPSAPLFIRCLRKGSNKFSLQMVWSSTRIVVCPFPVPSPFSVQTSLPRTSHPLMCHPTNARPQPTDLSLPIQGVLTCQSHWCAPPNMLPQQQDGNECSNSSFSVFLLTFWKKRNPSPHLKLLEATPPQRQFLSSENRKGEGHQNMFQNNAEKNKYVCLILLGILSPGINFYLLLNPIAHARIPWPLLLLKQSLWLC